MPVRRIKKGEPGHGRKKFVATGEYQGKPYTVRFGDPNMEIKRDDPKRRKAFRDRMGCDKPGPLRQRLRLSKVKGRDLRQRRRQ